MKYYETLLNGMSGRNSFKNSYYIASKSYHYKKIIKLKPIFRDKK